MNVSGDYKPGPDPLDLLPRSPAAWILQADVDVRIFLPGWRQLFLFVDCELVETLEQAGYKQRNLIHDVVLANTLDLSFKRSFELGYDVARHLRIWAQKRTG